MSNDDNSKLKAINILIVVFALVNVLIIALTVVNYMQDGKFSLTSVVVGLTTLPSILLIRASLKKRNNL